MNAVFQDAFLGRGTESPYVAIFNYMIQFDEDVPKNTRKYSTALTPSRQVRQRSEELANLRVELKRGYGTIKGAPDAEKEKYAETQNALRAARQKQDRKALKAIVREYFLQKEKDLLSKQAQGIPQKELATKGVKFQQPERMRLAELFGDMAEDIPEAMILQRKIDTINTAVAYAWKAELGVVPPFHPLQQESPRGFTPKPKLSGPSPELSQVAAPVNHPTAPISDQSPRLLYKKPESNTTPDSPPQVPDPKSRGKRSDPCIFCGKYFASTNKLWNHVDNMHLRRRETPHVVCPDVLCKAKGVTLESERSFKLHALRVHKRPLRKPDLDDSDYESMGVEPRPRIVIKTPSMSPSTLSCSSPIVPKIVIKNWCTPCT